MKADDIFDGVTDIRDDQINGARRPPGRRGKWWFPLIAAVLTVAIVGGIVLHPGGGATAYALAEAAYPQMAAYPDEAEYTKPNGEVEDSYYEAYDAWWEDVKAQRRDLGDTTSLQKFFSRSAETFLSEAEGENRLYSPLNVYMALSMLAQITDGESREQILSLLGSGDMDTLRQQASDVWNANYRDDGALTCILASSVWLNEGIPFRQETLDTLAETFYASSYQGEMGSDDFNKALQDWLSQQTGGLLEQQAGEVELDTQTILALATTVYFKARWESEFSQAETSPQTFHSPDGEETCDFMHQQSLQGYFRGEKFSAVFRGFSEGATMWFLLPDEGIRAEDMLLDTEVMDFLFAGDESRSEKYREAKVNEAIPKFDVSCHFDLRDGLRALGVTDVLDAETADFSPITDEYASLALSRADHAARVVIDEEGCTAAAFTVMGMDGAGFIGEDEVDFVLDRPFLFCITGDSGLPLFVGIVNHP